MRLDRLLSIVIILLNRTKVTARELSEKFEVSVRTIYRDIDAINLTGIPIVSYPGNDGGFGIMENYKMDKQLFTLSDMTAMLRALKGINLTLENSELDKAIEKINHLVPDEKNDELSLQMEQLVIDIVPWGFSKKYKAYVKDINRAVTTSRIIKFDYQSNRGEVTSRKIEPMTLIFKGYNWYLFGYCLKREDYRLFKVSRMDMLAIEKEGFLRKEESYKKYYGELEEEPRSRIDLKLRFNPEIKLRVIEYFGEDKMEMDDNGRIVVTVSFPEDQWVYSTILSYGEHVEVVEPASVKEIIKEKIKKMNSLYQT